MKNNEPVKVLSAEQTALITELTDRYGIEPEDILFFSEKPDPFFTYEATCILCNQLTDLQDIDIQPIQSVSGDSLTLKCNLIRSNGQTRGAVGVANFNETIDGGKMSDQQLFLLASSRAIRNALKTAGIDLLKLHRRSISGEDVLEFNPQKSAFNSYLAQAHILGKQAGLINGDDKGSWRKVLWNRYKVETSGELTEHELADFVAVLNTLVSEPKQAQAA